MVAYSERVLGLKVIHPARYRLPLTIPWARAALVPRALPGQQVTIVHLCCRGPQQAATWTCNAFVTRHNHHGIPLFLSLHRRLPHRLFILQRVSPRPLPLAKLTSCTTINKGISLVNEKFPKATSRRPRQKSDIIENNRNELAWGAKTIKFTASLTQ